MAYTPRDQPPLVYHPEYSADPWPAAHRFVMSKFRDLHADLLARPPPGSPLAFLQVLGCAVKRFRIYGHSCSRTKPRQIKRQKEKRRQYFHFPIPNPKVFWGE